MPQGQLPPRFRTTVPDGDTVQRKVCERCGYIDYVNPKIVVGAVVRAGGRILLCRRAIEPRRGFWTIPAGYLEQHETPEDGARRETREEAQAEIALTDLLAVYTIRRLSQVQLIYRARLEGGYAAGPESLEVGLFSFDEVPWSAIAFPSVVWALRQDEDVARGVAQAPFSNPPGADGDMAAFTGEGGEARAP